MNQELEEWALKVRNFYEQEITKLDPNTYMGRYPEVCDKRLKDTGKARKEGIHFKIIDRTKYDWKNPYWDPLLVIQKGEGNLEAYCIETGALAGDWRVEAYQLIQDWLVKNGFKKEDSLYYGSIPWLDRFKKRS